jgi:hypothetical protein
MRVEKLAALKLDQKSRSLTIWMCATLGPCSNQQAQPHQTSSRPPPTAEMCIQLRHSATQALLAQPLRIYFWAKAPVSRSEYPPCSSHHEINWGDSGAAISCVKGRWFSLTLARFPPLFPADDVVIYQQPRCTMKVPTPPESICPDQHVPLF